MGKEKRGSREVKSSPEAEQARGRIQDMVGLPAEERTDAMPGILEAIKALPPQGAEHVLVEAARRDQTVLLPLLEALLDDPEYAPAAAEALGYIRSEEALPVLQGIDSPQHPKAVLKAARRALHHLKSQGITVEEAVPSPSPEGRARGGWRILRSIMSPVDPEGGQFFAVYLSVPLSGPELVQVIASDTEGVFETSSIPLTKRELEDYLAEAEEHGMILVDAPADYVLHGVRWYEAINREKDNPFPFKFHLYRDAFHASDREYENALVYESVDLDAVKSDGALREEVLVLFAETREFGRWSLPNEQIEPFALRLIEAKESPLVLSETAEEERFERVFKDAAETVFTPEVRALYKRRIEENASVLMLTDREELAKIAVACALQMSPDGPPVAEIDFVDAMIKRSIVGYMAEEADEPRIHRV